MKKLSKLKNSPSLKILSFKKIQKLKGGNGNGNGNGSNNGNSYGNNGYGNSGCPPPEEN